MKKLTTLMLGLSLALGSVTIVSAQDTSATTKKKTKKTKKSKKSSDTTKKSGSN
ncbi:MAG TPA: hypothetical protein VN736_29175 [Candidatus Limnocylindrales bacterium]|nr:hypothetical protein [Candidatus Limnocylindrales bacterium]